MTFSASWAARKREPTDASGKPKTNKQIQLDENSDSDEASNSELTSEIADDLRKAISPIEKHLLASVVIFGADGNLSSKKILPTLFNLWRRKLVPRDILIFGYARATIDSEAFRKHIFKCIYQPSQTQSDRKEFLRRCHYVSGQFDSIDGISRLSTLIAEEEALRQLSRQRHNAWALSRDPSGTEVAEQVRLYYMAVPPKLYSGICGALRAAMPAAAAAAAPSAASAAAASAATDETPAPLAENSQHRPTVRTRERFVLEKPFGRDTASFVELSSELSMLAEEETYRIDHYLGKELVMNLLVLRFANVCFGAIWNRQYIKNVQVIFKEDFGIEGRGGYFDEYGIVRDVLQNHLLQVMALVAMEQPLSFSAEDVLAEKIKVLRSIRPLELNNLAVGQYARCGSHAGYLEEPSVVNKQSTTETFAAAVLHVHNPRWEGVPFVLKAGKALTDRKVEVRIQFHKVPGAVGALANCVGNELVMRLQPEETIYWKVQNKVPGLIFEVQQIRMDLLYATKYSRHGKLPEAYERLLLEVLAGQKSNFVSSAELNLSWHIFTPVLHQLEHASHAPELYPFGSRGPSCADALAARFGMVKFGGGLHEAVDGPRPEPQQVVVPSRGGVMSSPPTADLASAMLRAGVGDPGSPSSPPGPGSTQCRS